MEIVHYLTRFQLEHGGVVRAVLDLCGALAERGHGVTVLTFDDTDVPDAWKGGAGEGTPRSVLLAAPSTPLGLLPRAAVRRAAKVVAASDVVHLHVPWAMSNRQIARECRRAEVPYILSVHGMLDDWCMTQSALRKRAYLALGGRRLLQRAAFVHCTAEAERDQVMPRVRGGRGRVVPLVFDLEPYRELPGPERARAAFPLADADRPKLLFLSRLHPKKGFELLLEAAAILAHRAGEEGDPAARPVVLAAGSGEASYVASLRERAAVLGLADDVAFLGMVTAEKVSLYQAADVFVLPTSQENFGFVLPEALACGVPAVTTKGVDIWPELEASGGAVIVPPEAEAIADAVEGLVADPERRRAMGAAGRAWVLDRLDGHRVVGEFEAMYDDARS